MKCQKYWVCEKSTTNQFQFRILSIHAKSLISITQGRKKIPTKKENHFADMIGSNFNLHFK
ncbi:hypothetical protein WN55_04301 [Dufourea novaeangliae]|uniref:Uncharacterized protein n=1 Tax=Dufourea novaeangliae TaxID=178035 RepID=A0A154PLN5_DUFNO|nr:hypothetical protein WN55_04301 [Dufourea novaeangliae]